MAQHNFDMLQVMLFGIEAQFTWVVCLSMALELFQRLHLQAVMGIMAIWNCPVSFPYSNTEYQGKMLYYPMKWGLATCYATQGWDNVCESSPLETKADAHLGVTLVSEMQTSAVLWVH
jgi:hypothetical protein